MKNYVHIKRKMLIAILCLASTGNNLAFLPYHGIQLSNKKKYTLDTFNNLGGYSEKYAE